MNNIFQTETIQIFDLETLSTSLTNAGIMQIGGCRVDIRERKITDRILINISKKDSVKFKFHICPKTIEFWKAQSPDVIATLNKDVVSITDGLEQFDSWLIKEKYLAAYGIFDHPILSNAFNKVLNRDPHWNFRKFLDLRTIQTLAGYQFPDNEMKHSAASDVETMANMLITIFNPE